MANLFKNPIVIDTPSGSVIYTQEIRVQAFRWVAPAAVAGNTCVVQDKNGTPIWESVASGTNYEDVDHLEFSFYGLIVPTLASGKLYIYVR
jgi:outer membrane protein assembly factor BamB